MKIRQVKCIYTKHLTKKRKLWNDGILKIINMSGTIHCELSDALSTRGIPLESRQLDKREVLKFRDTEDFELELENYIVSVSRLDNSASDAASGTKLPEPPLKLPKFIPPSRYVPISRVESRSNKAVPVHDSKVSTYNKYQVTSDELDDLWGNHHDDDTTTTAEKSQHTQYDDRSHAPMHTQSLKSNHSKSNMEHSDKGNNNYNNNSISYSRGPLEHYSNNTKSYGGDYHTNSPHKSYGNSNALTKANRGDDDDGDDDVNHPLKTAYRTTGAAPAGCLEAFTRNPSHDKTSNTARNQHPTSRFTSNNVPNCNSNSNIASQNQQHRRSEGTTCEYEKISISADHNRRNDDDDLKYLYNGDIGGNDVDEEDKSNQQRRLVLEHDPPQHMDHSRGRRKETTFVAASSSSSSSSSSYRQPSLLPSVGMWDDDDGNGKLTENHTYSDGSVSYNRSNDLLLSSSTKLIGYDIHRDRQELAHANIISLVQHDYHDDVRNASSSWNMFDTSIWNND